MFLPILKTVIGKNLGIDSLLTPIILHLTVSNRCNSRCSMCNIWKEDRKEDIKLKCLTKYKNSPFGRYLRILDITGGEPFLCDVPSIIKAVDNGKIRLILISTNGFLSEKIERDLKSILNMTRSNIIIDVSIDGIGKKHDEIRGVAGAYERALGTVKRLKSLREDRIRISWKLTILKENLEQIVDCYKKAKELDVDFTCKPGANFGFLHNDDMDFELKKEDCKKIINALMEIQGLRRNNRNNKGLSLWERVFIVANDLFHDKLIEYYKILREGSKSMITPCYSSFLSMMLHNDGIIYSCPTLMQEMGDVDENSLKSIWLSDNAKKIRKFINAKRCACFSQCDQMPSIVMGNIPKIIKGVIVSYLG